MNEEIRFNADGATLHGDLMVPDDARGLVIFAHGSGSSRFSSRNRYVADTLSRTGSYATLLFDLLSESEDSVYANRFDITTLSRRLESVTSTVAERPDLAHLPIGFFGASTGAAAAIVAATHLTARVKAVVSRGGRPDLAGDSLRALTAPVLLIVGGLDDIVIGLNEDALALIPAENKTLTIVPGATHLFEEPGTLARAAALALAWFDRYLV